MKSSLCVNRPPQHPHHFTLFLSLSQSYHLQTLTTLSRRPFSRLPPPHRRPININTTIKQLPIPFPTRSIITRALNPSFSFDCTSN